MWKLPKISLDVKDNGDIVSINYENCKTSYNKKQTLVLELPIGDWFN